MYAKNRKLGYCARKNRYRQFSFLPALNLGGRWMAEAGFQIGQQVRVTVENGKITIEA
ncbi:SymE family type I addiction module toxin [Rudanella lutea]|uniref:SymE family type I addiction module toxin n=1 Tax=Rudanella lutea TaxID=451374 RepID=UPI000370F36B|nr:SymE family type I addiction module toxin [Rudanella lutea]